MKLCKDCLLPDSKPDLFIDQDGMCSACLNFRNRPTIDYTKRKESLLLLCEKYRNPKGYDCIVPSSGGKDSTFQALKMRELGMHPLIVTVTTDHLTELGRRNIENLKLQGFDTMEVTPNPKVRRQINRFALEMVGDISWPEHLLIFTVPVRMACQLGIPLIVWGENSQHEYGGPAAAVQAQVLTRRWLEEFGGLNGLRVSDVQQMLNLSDKDMIPYLYPTDHELAAASVTGVFLGYFIPWDGHQNALYSQLHGFTYYDKWVEGSFGCYENLDNAQTGIHDYFKWLKYGYGRATDIVSMHIRRGLLSREDGLRIIQARDGTYPASYLGVSLETVLEEIGMTRLEFDAVCNRFKNRKIHERNHCAV